MNNDNAFLRRVKHKKVIEEEYVAFIQPPGERFRELAPRATFEQAEASLREALLAERPGTQGSIEKYLVVREVEADGE